MYVKRRALEDLPCITEAHASKAERADIDSCCGCKLTVTEQGRSCCCHDDTFFSEIIFKNLNEEDASVEVD
jgi:hypothetical protein